MISRDHTGLRAGIALLIGAALAAAQLCSGAAFAEGSFFKDRPANTTEAAQAKAAPPATPTVTTPVPPSPPPAVSPAPPVPSPQPRSPPLAPAQVPDQQPQPPPSAGSAMLSGPVNEVLSTDTFRVNGQQVQIAGIRGRAVMLAGLKNWIAGNGGQLNCRAVGAKYRCATPNNKDVGLIVLANGAAEVDAGAPPEYRQAELQAQASHKGIWAQR